MDNVHSVARYIAQWHQQKYGCPISEMKLHKLLYFAQRESYIVRNEQLFSGDFEAWQYGPVIPAIRADYWWIANGDPFHEHLPSPPLSAEGRHVIDSTLETYGYKDAWSLSRLSHGELSWQNARGGLPTQARCSTSIKPADIAEDANRVRARRALFP